MQNHLIFKNNVIPVILNGLRMDKNQKKCNYQKFSDIIKTSVKKLFINYLEKMYQGLL